MPVFSRRQLVVLVLLTLVWGFNWPVMKLGVTHFPPLSFRMASMWIGLPILALVMWHQKAPFTIPRAHWPRVALLLWHQMGALGSRPVGMLLILISAASWALGTQQLRRLQVPVPLLTLSFWMVAITGAVLTALAVAFERQQWHAPNAQAWAAIVYNGVLVLGFAQTAWFFLVRTLPPVASTLSVMMIPVIGVFSGALWLSEVLHWQDWAAVALMVAAIASVLWPARKTRQNLSQNRLQRLSIKRL